MTKRLAKPTRKEALAKLLELDIDEITDIKNGRDENSFNLGEKEYLVLTDAEADKRADEYIRDCVWSFNG